jgi:DNA topoisomerase III
VQCQKCDFTLWRVVSGREWAPEELAELFTKRFVGPLTGFRSKQGRPFSAGMRLNDEMRLEFDFGQGAGDGGEAPDFSGQEPLGACPKCAARVFEHGVAYVCEKAVGPERKCDFRSGRLILQQPIEREQMKKLLETGRTDLLTSFVSKKNRKFKAFLVKQPDGKIGFEFQPRAPKEPKNKAPEEKTTRPGSARRAR